MRFDSLTELTSTLGHRGYSVTEPEVGAALTALQLFFPLDEADLPDIRAYLGPARPLAKNNWKALIEAAAAVSQATFHAHRSVVEEGRHRLFASTTAPFGIDDEEAENWIATADHQWGSPQGMSAWESLLANMPAQDKEPSRPSHSWAWQKALANMPEPDKGTALPDRSWLLDAIPCIENDPRVGNCGPWAAPDGSPMGWLRSVADFVVAWTPWDRGQATLALLTDCAPIIPLLAYQVQEQYEGMKSSIWVLFPRAVPLMFPPTDPKTVVGVSAITVGFPWVPGWAVDAVYRGAAPGQEAMKVMGRRKRAAPRRDAVIAFARGHPELSWLDRWVLWNKEHPDSVYNSWRSFRQASRR